MPKIVGILTFMNMINFMLSCVEHEKSFIPSGPVQNCKEFIVCTISLAAVIAKLIEKNVKPRLYAQFAP